MSEHCETSCESSCQASQQPLKVAIIGSGSAAFAAAIQLAKAGAKVWMIEQQPQIGGTCVNVGCVPSKILISAAKIAQESKQTAFPALKLSSFSLDRAGLAQQIQSRVEELRLAKYEDVLADYPSIELIHGRAKFLSSQSLKIELASGGVQQIEADKVLIATGSRPHVPEIEGLTETPYWTSTEALFTPTTPKSLIVVGASAVALEMAQAFLRLGTKVTLLARTTLLSQEEAAIGALLTKVLVKEGMTILEHTTLHSVSYSENAFHCVTQMGEQLCAEQLLIATGRQANTDGLNLESAGVLVDARGRIKVNENLQTTQPSIYAAGDCTQSPQFVYVAAAAGTRAGKNMLGGQERLDLSVLPKVVFTDPQVATVGLSPEQAEAQGMKVVSRKLDLVHVPRALANFKTEGFIQLVAEAETLRLVGAQMVADVAGEIIQTASMAIAQGMTVNDLAEMLFPYLTQVEGLKLCAQTFTQDVSQLSCCAG